VYIFQGSNLVVPDSLPDSRSTEEIPPEKAEAAFGGARNGADYYEVPAADGGRPVPGLLLPPQASLPPGWRAFSLRQALAFLPSTDGPPCGGGEAEKLFRVYHIMQWRRESAFCGSCGTPNGEAAEVPARLCPACGRLEFPRISPAIIVLVVNDRDEVLLAHNKKFIPRVYSLIAGFSEPGENLETTAAREIREEVSVEVRDIRYAASQPWPFPNSLMIGFTARYEGGTIKPDGVEIEDARWFSREDLPELPGPGSVSRCLIDRWIARDLFLR
jgi:NAD+ diphosphatase